MVHVPAHAPRLQLGQLQERPDPTRIAALSGALAVNAAALLLLLMPVAAPDPVPVPDAPLVVYPELQRTKPVPVQPIPVPVAKPQPRTPVATPQPHTALAPPDPPVLVAEGTGPAPASDPVVEASVPSAPGPVAAMRLEYAHAPPPAYPRGALRTGLQGTVMLQVLVATDGTPLEVAIAQSSGHRQLDEAARRHVLRHWTFRPAMQGGRPVQAIGLVPIAFNLER